MTLICSRSLRRVCWLQIDERDEESSPSAVLTTEFFEWCCKYFTEPLMNVSAENDPHGTARFEHEFRFQQAATARRHATNDRHRASQSVIPPGIVRPCITSHIHVVTCAGFYASHVNQKGAQGKVASRNSERQRVAAKKVGRNV